MYRKKFMVIATVFVMGLLGVMIWSSNVVADHNQNVNAGNGPTIEEGDFGKEHLKDIEQQEQIEQPDAPARPEVDMQQTNRRPSEPLLINDQNIEPRIEYRSKRAKRIPTNYLEDLADMSKLILWNKSTFPLKVFIKDEANIDNDFLSGIKSGFSNWQRVSKSFVAFDFVLDQKDANIIVEVVDTPTVDCSVEENGIDYGFEIQGNLLKSAYMKVPKKNCDGSDVENSNLYVAVQHSLGHVLGIQNHSTTSTDTMYAESTYENVNVTGADVDTLKLLYYFTPKVSNKGYTSKELQGKLRFSAIKNMSQSEIDDYLLENAPDEDNTNKKMETLISEGLKAYDQNNYQEAISSLSSALPMATDKKDISFLNKNLAVIYLKSGDAKSALKYAQVAEDLNHEPLNQFLLAYVNNQLGQQDEALNILSVLLKHYPRLRQSYVLAAQIYNERQDVDKLVEISKQSLGNFPTNPPVVYTPPVTSEEQIDESAGESENQDEGSEAESGESVSE